MGHVDCGTCGLWEVWTVGRVDCRTCGLWDMRDMRTAGHVLWISVNEMQNSLADIEGVFLDQFLRGL